MKKVIIAEKPLLQGILQMLITLKIERWIF